MSNTLNTSFGTASQDTFDAGGLRYGQFVANLDVNREYQIGLAGPLSVAAGLEYRSENFRIRPGDLQSYATGPLFRASFTTTAANCATQGGVFNAGTSICCFPGRAAPAGAQGFPGIPAASATDEGRHSFAAYVELDADICAGLHRRPRRPLRAFLRFRRHAERQARAPLRAGPRLRAARLGLERLPGAFAPPAISSPPRRPISSTACRSTSARSRSTARSRARWARTISSRKSRSTSASARPPIRSPGSPSRSMPTRSTSTTGSC